MKKKTSIDWLISKMKHIIPNFFNEIIKESHEKHKQEIIDAYRDGRSDQQSEDSKFYNRNAEYYYSEKFIENKKI